MQIINCEQNSAEWHQHRCGVITASSFHKVLAKGEGKTRRKYLMELAAEKIRGVAGDSFTSAYMARGHEYEGTAIELYEEITENKVEKVGFIKDGDFGFSPDGLVGNDGTIEAKTKSGDIQIEILLADKVPTEHIAQIQGGLFVSKRKWCDFVSYCPGLPLFIKRIERDEKYILELQMELAKFKKELKEAIEQITNKF